MQWKGADRGVFGGVDTAVAPVEYCRTMDPWESLLLGGLQGATEFLPVSSSGHLVLAEHLLRLRPSLGHAA